MTVTRTARRQAAAGTRFRGSSCRDPTAGLQPDVGQRRRGQAFVGRVVRHLTEPVVTPGVPLRSRSVDLVVAAGHEVPPHDDLLGERLAAEQEHPRVRRELELERRAVHAEVHRLPVRHRGPLDGRRPGQRDEDVLVCGIERQPARALPAVGGQLRAHQRGEALRSRGHAAERPQEDPREHPVGLEERRRFVQDEAPGAMPLAVGQRDPQLRAVEHAVGRAGRGRHDVLAVGDAVAGGHDRRPPGDDLRGRAQRVAVGHLAGDEPRHGLQAGMRVRCHVHRVPVTGRDRSRAVEVDEAPRADHPALAVREQAQHLAAWADLGVDRVVDRRLATVTLRVVRAAGIQVRDGIAHAGY